MSDRLTSRMLVDALIRRVQAEGGFATVLHKGESIGGAIVVLLAERGENIGLFERVTSINGQMDLVAIGPQNLSENSVLTQYLDRRLGVDPDIWFLELDVADGQRLAAELLCAG